MKRIAVILTLATSFFTTTAHAENFSLTAGAMGNIYVVDARPQLEPGLGGFFSFDYRWSPSFAVSTSVMVTTQNGEGISAGNNDILVMGIPTVDFKYYMIPEASHFDPYVVGGLGFYLVSNGTNSTGTQAAGMGCQAGLGLDFYFTPKMSANVAGIFRSIALIDSTTGSNNGTAIFPFSLQGGIGYHF